MRKSPRDARPGRIQTAAQKENGGHARVPSRSEREGSDKISEEPLASTDNGLEMKLQKIEEFAMKRLRDIHGLLGGDVLRTKLELAKHCRDITPTPKGNSYVVSGDWNLLGGCSGGAGGTACTVLPQVHFREKWPKR
jgi:hypothetical protein